MQLGGMQITQVFGGIYSSLTGSEQRPLCHYQVIVRQHKKATMVTINVLEFLTEIINYAAMTVYVNSHPLVAGNEFPVLLNWTDNTTAKAWIRKAALKSQIAKNLQQILCGIMVNNPLDVACQHIA